MKITFEHAGVQRTLAKHPLVQQALKRAEITPAAAALRPWYLRLEEGGKTVKLKLRALKEADAVREAKDLLQARVKQPNEFAAFLDARAAKRTLTIGALAKDWFAAGLPFSPTRTRAANAARELKTRLTRALPYWDKIAVATVKPGTHADFVVWRRASIKHPRNGHSGSRTADIELAALSCLCQWAVKMERLEKNPFEKREHFTESNTVRHCHEGMPANDDEFHRVLTAIWADQPVKQADNTTVLQPGAPDRLVAGAWLAFTTLTGLRPGEHPHLQRVPAADKFPADLVAAPCGLIYPMPDGMKRMKVLRTKRGQNPAVLIHPALADFLAHYLPWVNQHFPNDTRLFPLNDVEGQLNQYLRRACVNVGAKHMKPHGFGRAYYVRVRRSQGIDDTTIAAELGQKSDGTLIRSVYGNPMDPVGGNLHDWLPAEGIPAWRQLTPATQTNIIPLAKA